MANKKIKKAASENDGEIEVEVEDEVKDSPQVVATTTKLSNNNDLKDLIEKNIKWSQVIYNQNKKIKHRLTMMVVGNYLRLALIIAPIILGIIYLPSLIKQFSAQYQDVLGGMGLPIGNIGDLLGQLQGGGASINISDDQVQEVLRNIPR